MAVVSVPRQTTKKGFGLIETTNSELETSHSENENVSLNAFHLGDDDQRWQFLWRLSEIGEEGLLQATSHVWNMLAHPEELRATMMAANAKVPGKGKTGLLNVLKKFLEEFEVETDPPPLPDRASYETSDEWHEAVAWHFERGEQAITSVIERYSTLLNGDKPVLSPPGAVLKGPWPGPPEN